MKHEKYDTSKVKTITLNGKKYIDMSVIEDIRKALHADITYISDNNGGWCELSEHVAIEMIDRIIDRKVNEVADGKDN